MVDLVRWEGGGKKNKENLSDQGMVSATNKLNPNLSPGQHQPLAKSLVRSDQYLVLLPVFHFHSPNDTKDAMLLSNIVTEPWAQ